MPIAIDNLANVPCTCGENPLWHEDEKRLYWTDIPNRTLYRYDPATGEREQFDVGREVGGFTIQADGALLLFMDRGTIATWRDGAFIRTIVEAIDGEQRSRFNDVIADPHGRVFCGTMPGPDRLGRLYRLETDGSIEPVVYELGCSNGLGFSPDLKTLYFTDSKPRTIDAFDYEADTGSLSNRRNLVSLPEGVGNPDGMTVDAEGRLWSARWLGGAVACHGADGRELHKIETPETLVVSSVTFGGDDLTDMYLTTARGDDREKHGPCAGSLLRVRGHGATGRREFRSRVV